MHKFLFLLFDDENHGENLAKIDSKLIQSFMGKSSDNTKVSVIWNDIKLCIIGETSIEFTKEEILKLLTNEADAVRINVWDYRIKKVTEELLEIGMRDSNPSLALRVAKRYMEEGGVLTRKGAVEALCRLDVVGSYFKFNEQRIMADVEAKELKMSFAKTKTLEVNRAL